MPGKHWPAAPAAVAYCEAIQPASSAYGDWSSILTKAQNDRLHRLDDRQLPGRATASPTAPASIFHSRNEGRQYPLEGDMLMTRH